MFLEFDNLMANNEFVSVVIMSYFRPEMTLDLLRSIHENVDMPFEIILHDDHSEDWVQDKIFAEMRSLCSTIILGQGNVNMGYSSSVNRGVALCNSDYILILDNDCLITAPCFKTIKEVLDVPYVGTVSPREFIEMAPGSTHGSRATVKTNGNAFTLSCIPSGSFAFRKKVWMEIGGFPQVYSNGGDISFIFSLLRHGYFNAGSLISPTGNAFSTVRNIDQETGYPNATARIRNFDQAYPRIFPFCNDKGNFSLACHARRERRHPLSQEQYLADGGYHNIAYWDAWANDCYDGQGNIIWDKVGDWGHSKWRDRIDADIKAWKEEV